MTGGRGQRTDSAASKTTLVVALTALDGSRRIEAISGAEMTLDGDFRVHVYAREDAVAT